MKHKIKIENTNFKGGSPDTTPKPTALDLTKSKEAIKEYNDYLQYGVPLENEQIENWTTQMLDDQGKVKTDVGAVNLEAERRYPMSVDPNKYQSSFDRLSTKNEIGNNLAQEQNSQYDKGLLASYQMGQGLEQENFDAGQRLQNRHARDVIRKTDDEFRDKQQYDKNISGALGVALEQSQRPTVKE